MALWLETDSSSNVNISSATAVGVYTATGDVWVAPQLLVDQVAGGGDYVYYVTLQVGGSGSSYVFGPKTTHTAAAGETAVGSQGIFVFARGGDVMTVYVDGLAGDTTTPDPMVRWAAIPLPAAAAGAAGGVALVGSTMMPDAAGTRAALGMAAADLDTQLDTLIASTAAIQAVTDLIDTSAVTVTTSNNAGLLTVYRGVTFAATVSGLTISASWTKVYLTIKTDLDLADTAATIQVVETNPGAGTDGLLYLNGAAPVNPITYADASLTVDQGAGTVAIALSDNLTAQLARGARLHWDLKQIISSTSSGLLASGTMDIELTPTRTI